MFSGGRFSGLYSSHCSLFRLLRWSSGENVETANAQQPSAQNDNAATTDVMEQLKAQLQEKDKTLEELHVQVHDLEVSVAAQCHTHMWRDSACRFLLSAFIVFSWCIRTSTSAV